MLRLAKMRTETMYKLELQLPRIRACSSSSNCNRGAAASCLASNCERER
jgi:hypothetical protein